jgi:hypothetical protein
MDAKQRCCGLLKAKNKQCSNNGKYVDQKTGKHYCGHHYKKGDTKPPAIRDCEPSRPSQVAKPATVKEPWKTLGLPDPSKELRVSVLKRLVTRLNRGPKPNDSSGYLYVYSLASEEGLNYWKVGMTTRTVTERKKEWQAKHPGFTLMMKEYYHVPTKAVRCLERVVHLYLDHRRMHRYPILGGKALFSVWSATGVAVDANSKQQQKERLVATTKMVEWFCLPWSELSPLLDALVKYYSALALVDL